ncbi:MAG: hypothetical protein IT161_05385 [Bryobacterales bacterium]|nr:hypothetical protein [Bryobacterales bacterium]
MKSLFLPALFAAMAVVAPAAASEISGQWKLHSNIQGHESDFECTLTQTGQDLAGSCKSGQLELKITGKVEEKKLTFQYKTDYEGQELTIVHTGTLETPAKMAGSVDVQPMGVAGEFTAIQANQPAN